MMTSLPPMMNVMKDIGGVEMPDYLLKMNGEAEDGNGSTATKADVGTATAVKTPATSKPKLDEGKPPKAS